MGKKATVEMTVKWGSIGKNEIKKAAQEAQTMASVENFHCF